MGKEGFRRVALRNGLNKTMPLIHPVVSMALATLFLSMHTDDGEITRLTPAQGTSQCLPEARIEEGLFRGYHERGVIIFSRPCGELAVRSRIVRFHPV